MLEDMKTAPEIVTPKEFAATGQFLPTSELSAVDLYTAIGAELLK
jgi:spermidine/putrescine transport system substrate-binding protein